MKNVILVAVAVLFCLFPVALAGAKMNADAAPVGDAVLVPQDAPSNTVPAVEASVSVAEPTGSIAVPSVKAKVVTTVRAKKSPREGTSVNRCRHEYRLGGEVWTCQ